MSPAAVLTVAQAPPAVTSSGSHIQCTHVPPSAAEAQEHSAPRQPQLAAGSAPAPAHGAVCCSLRKAQPANSGGMCLLTGFPPAKDGQGRPAANPSEVCRAFPRLAPLPASTARCHRAEKNQIYGLIENRLMTRGPLQAPAQLPGRVYTLQQQNGD